ncbi:probable RNA-binding protein ARP1 isoform X1 [Musa acuminata AAA Group]|uniref:probable RNA-binding protein ARP1 isoform X1 n=1 Tax=Musa acuminata AAA Group TaxID=214697 RepID=UPI0031D0B431
MGQQFGDTTLTKVFVGGLAWETQKEALRDHFQRYGEILEAVIISDKITGRSKGYGFVTFKEAEAAKKACEDATPMINGRRANCNLASLGAKRSGLRPSPPSTPAPLPSHAHHPPPGMVVVSRSVSPAAQWYYPPTSGTPPPPSPFQLQHYHGVVPFYAAAAYGYSPNYVTDLGYNAQKLSHGGGGGGGGGYFQGQFSYPAQGGMVAPHGMLPVYPLYHLQNQQGMGVPAHFFPPAGAAMTTIPTIISKPTVIPPPATVCVAVEQVKGSS